MVKRVLLGTKPLGLGVDTSCIMLYTVYRYETNRHKRVEKELEERA